jgi:indole-3-glycerol phosphate synthase
MATGAPPILTRIVEARRASVERFKAAGGAERLRHEVAQAPPVRDFRAAITGQGVALIAECKQRSPSGGVLQSPYDPVALARRYVDAGAAALSVLTEPEFFGGAPEHLLAVRRAVPVPVLCKDFILDAAQVMGARAMGADCILLIAAILDDPSLVGLQATAQAFGMQSLVEVHSQDETRRAVALGATLIGINNRDLTQMSIDQATTARLRALIPADRTVVSESGIQTRQDVEALARLRVDAVLVGEALLRAANLEAKVKELMGT